MAEKRFHTRGFISLLTALSSIFMTLSGIVLYLVPHGKVAYWVNWRLLYLTKENWTDMHVLTSLLFALGASYHIYLNWAVLKAYIVKKAERVLSLKKELAIASALTIVFVIASIYRVPPLSYVLELSDHLKESWIADKALEPPFSRAEQLSLRNFADRTSIDLDAAVAELQKRGINIESLDKPMYKIAEANNTSPMEIYRIIKAFPKSGQGKASPGITSKETEGHSTGPGISKRTSPQISGQGKAPAGLTAKEIEERYAGSGIGKKTLSQIVQDTGVAIDKAKQRLSNRGIQMKEEDTLKQTADKHGMAPIDVLKIILLDTGDK